jgi:hypothetical protein
LPDIFSTEESGICIVICMDVQDLAARTVEALVPYMTGVATQVGERITDATAEHLYELVRTRLSGEQRSRSALDELQEQPQDVQRQTIVKDALAAAVARDADFAQTLTEAVGQLQAAARITVNHGGSTIGQHGSTATSITINRIHRGSIAMGSMTISKASSALLWFGVTLAIGLILVISGWAFARYLLANEQSDPTELGGLKLNDYCASIGFNGGSFYMRGDPYSWECRGSGAAPRKIDMNEACQWQYDKARVEARYSREGDRWYCMDNQ